MSYYSVFRLLSTDLIYLIDMIYNGLDGESITFIHASWQELSDPSGSKIFQVKANFPAYILFISEYVAGIMPTENAPELVIAEVCASFEQDGV